MPNPAYKVDINANAAFAVKNTTRQFWRLYEGGQSNASQYRAIMDCMSGGSDEIKSQLLLALYRSKMIPANWDNIVEVYIHDSNADTISQGTDFPLAGQAVTIRTQLVMQNNGWKVDLSLVGITSSIRGADVKVNAPELYAEFESNKVTAGLKYVANPPDIWLRYLDRKVGNPRVLYILHTKNHLQVVKVRKA